LQIGRRLKWLGRKELIELVLRLCSTWVFEMFGYGEKISNRLDEFCQIYVKPTLKELNIYGHREQIRANKFLNKLLRDNNNGIRSIYESYKNDSYLFTVKSAFSIFSELEHDMYYVTRKNIKE